MWEIDLANQIETFLYSIPLGFSFGVLFYITEGLSRATPHKRVKRWITDILFFLISGFITYCFLLARSKGEVRGYVLVGELIGFWICKRLFSKIFIRFFGWLADSIRRLKLALFGAVTRAVCQMCAILRKTFKKLKNYEKKRLKNQDEIVYTETNNTEECE